MENKDKHPLEGVEYGEEVCHDDGGLTDEEETKGPCETQQAQQGKSPHDPGPARKKIQRKTKVSVDNL